MSARNGNSVGGCSHNVARANLRPPSDFRRRCAKKLEELGDIARDSKKHDEAIRYYSNARSLDPMNDDILLKWSKEVRGVFHVPSNNPADPYYQDIELNPSSHTGYKRKHVALHGMRRHSEAFEAFGVMLSRLEQSPDPQIRSKPFYQYCT